MEFLFLLLLLLVLALDFASLASHLSMDAKVSVSEPNRANCMISASSCSCWSSSVLSLNSSLVNTGSGGWKSSSSGIFSCIVMFLVAAAVVWELFCLGVAKGEVVLELCVFGRAGGIVVVWFALLGLFMVSSGDVVDSGVLSLFFEVVGVAVLAVVFLLGCSVGVMGEERGRLLPVGVGTGRTSEVCVGGAAGCWCCLGEALGAAGFGERAPPLAMGLIRVLMELACCCFLASSRYFLYIGFSLLCLTWSAVRPVAAVISRTDIVFRLLASILAILSSSSVSDVGAIDLASAIYSVGCCRRSC